MRNKAAFDVLGLGCVAIDDLIYVPSYPPPDSKVRVERRERAAGGLTGLALIAASRLGSRCAYAGVLGDDDLSLHARRLLEAEGIDTRGVDVQDGARPIYSTIVVDEGRQSRNIFFDMNGVFGPQPRSIDRALIRSSRVLLVDHLGVDGMIEAARVAREAGVPVVADFEDIDQPRFEELLGCVDHLILSRETALALSGASTPGDAALALRASDREVVAVTAGVEGCWYLDCEERRPQHQPAFAVKTVDTTGCGDVFHGAYASALARGLDLPGRIRFAAAAAALKATRRGGQKAVPDRAAVEALLGGAI